MRYFSIPGRQQLYLADLLIRFVPCAPRRQFNPPADTLPIAPPAPPGQVVGEGVGRVVVGAYPVDGSS